MATDPAIRRLVLRTLLAAFGGTTAPEPARRLVADGLAGFTLFARNVADQPQLRSLTDSLRQVRRDVLIGIDEEGGDVTRLAHATGSPYPGNAALGVVDDPALTRRVYRAIGAELRATGVNLDLAPAVDVNTADDNPIIGTRSFGADPTAVAIHSAAAVTGLQSTGVAACAKHFPGHGATLVDSHLGLPTVDEPLAVLRGRDLPPFAAAVAADVRAVMTAHIRVPGLTGEDPATFSPAAVALLRDGYGFDGVVVTDALEMAGAAGPAGGVGAAAVRALLAGADLLCLGARVDADLVEKVVAEVASAVADAVLPVARLEQAADRTAALAAWTAYGAGADPTPPDLGYQAALRAVRVDGDVAGLSAAVVVQLASAATIAEGRPPWGVAGHLPAVQTADAATDTAEDLRARAGDRPIVLVGRHLHRDPDTRALVETVAAAHPCVVVEMGWPAAWRPAGARAYVTTHGAGHACGRALVSTLGLA